MLIAGTFFGFGWSAPESAHAATGDIVAAGSITAGDKIYYGNYPQTKAASTPDDAPESPSTGNIYTDSNSIKYQYVDSTNDENDGWYKYEPIAWRVLKNASGQLFLLSEKGIDTKKYNEATGYITWGECTARSWLNGYAASENTRNENYSAAGTNFIGNAFSAAEQGFIPTTDVDNPLYNSDVGGVNTNDKIFYLKVADVDNNVSYGFTTDESRLAQPTDYTIALGAYVNLGYSCWWLRSPGNVGYYATFVYQNGGINLGGSYSINSPILTDRPAFYLETPGVVFRETNVANAYQATPASTDATLSNLGVSPGTLSPVFASETEEYAVEVPYSASSITLTATTTDTNASVTGDGVKSLNVGQNKFEITVTAEDGITQKTYTVTVTRAAPDKTANDDEDEDDDDSDEDDDDSDVEDDDDEDSDAVSEDENNDSGDSGSGITSQPKTGDASMLVWLAAMLMSAAVLMLFVLIRRRKAVKFH
jgi:LPXTG-motif cell wall-anchored protein